MGGRRRNGCEGPFTAIQVGAWIYQLLAIGWFAVVAFGFLSGSPTPVAITAVLWSVFLVGAAGCWFWCQLADPSVVDTKCFVIRQHDAHYCAQCKKSVPGIDHHCKWLNTCVGTRTYFSFYTLTFFASFLFAWQIIALALLMSTWRSTLVEQKSMDVFGESTIGLYVVSAIGIALSVPPGAFYSGLFGFHTYLIARGITTYEYFIERSKMAKERRKKKTEALMQTAQKAASTSRAQQKPSTDPVANPEPRPTQESNDVSTV